MKRRAFLELLVAMIPFRSLFKLPPQPEERPTTFDFELPGELRPTDQPWLLQNEDYPYSFISGIDRPVKVTYETPDAIIHGWAYQGETLADVFQPGRSYVEFPPCMKD